LLTQAQKGGHVQPRVGLAGEIVFLWRQTMAPPAEVGGDDLEVHRPNLPQAGFPVLRVDAPEMHLPTEKRHPFSIQQQGARGQCGSPPGSGWLASTVLSRIAVVPLPAHSSPPSCSLRRRRWCLLASCTRCTAPLPRDEQRTLADPKSDEGATNAEEQNGHGSESQSDTPD